MSSLAVRNEAVHLCTVPHQKNDWSGFWIFWISDYEFPRQLKRMRKFWFCLINDLKFKQIWSGYQTLRKPDTMNPVICIAYKYALPTNVLYYTLWALSTWCLFQEVLRKPPFVGIFLTHCPSAFRPGRWALLCRLLGLVWLILFLHF